MLLKGDRPQETAGMKTVPDDLLRKIKSYSEQCQMSEDKNLRKYCIAGESGVDPDSESSTCGGLINMVASFANQDKCRSGAKTLTDGPTSGIVPTSVLTGILGGTP